MAKKQIKKTTRGSKAKSKSLPKMWVGVLMVVIVVIAGIVIVNLSQAGTQVSYKDQNIQVYEKIKKDREYYSKRGDVAAGQDLQAGNPTSTIEQNSNDSARVDPIDLTAPASATAATVVKTGKPVTPPNASQNKIQREDDPKPSDYPSSRVDPVQFLVESISKPNVAFASAQSRQNAINIAYSTQGKRYSDFGFAYNVPWCSLYVSWVSFWSGQPLNVWNPQQMYAYSGDVATIMYVNGKLRSRDGYQPRPGDFVFYSWNDGGLPYDHIGIVVSTTKGGINTIEGNTGHSSNLYSTVNARSWPYNSPNILGYGTYF